jgi:hypothetical protein
MPLTTYPTIEVINPELVKITEEPSGPYYLQKIDVLEAIEHIKKSRTSYASDAVWLRRLNFFEHILEMMDARVLISDAAAAKMHQIETGRQQ